MVKESIWCISVKSVVSSNDDTLNDLYLKIRYKYNKMCGPFFNCASSEIRIYKDGHYECEFLDNWNYRMGSDEDHIRYAKMYDGKQVYRKDKWDNHIEDNIYDDAGTRPDVVVSENLEDIAEIYHVCYLVEEQDDDYSFYHYIQRWMYRYDDDPIRNMIDVSKIEN